MRFPRLLAYSLAAAILLISVWSMMAQAAPVTDEIFMPALSGPAGDSVNIDPQPDSGRAASVTIPPQGGEVVATAVNGARFTLTIPDGALAQTTTITLTPVAEISGLPAVQLVGAVEIAPRNLWLLQAASLKIEPTQVVLVTEEYPFAYYGDGQDFHPYPIQPYSEALIFPIGKFDGGYGIAQGNTGANVVHVGATTFTPADPEAQIRSQISALIQAERERILQGEEPDPTLWPKILDLLMEHYNTVIRPLLQPSMTDCAFAEANMGKAISWLRTTTLLAGDATDPGADARFATASAEIMDALIKSIENCYREAAAPCVDWEDPQQVSEVLRYYRMLLLLGAEGNVPAPEDLLECIFVDVQLQSGKFLYEFQKDAEIGYDSSVRFQFVDDSVSGFGIYYPYFPPNQQAITPTAIVSVTALIDDVWQNVPLSKRFFCRDQKAERVQEVVITFAQTSGGEPLPPQVYADNIGCWRWTGTYLHDQDYYPAGGLKEYYFHVNGNFTLERVESPVYFPYASQGEINVSTLGYRYVSGEVDYDERLVHEADGDITCVQTLSTTQSDLPAVAHPGFPALSLPNAGFNLPREVGSSLGSELQVDIPYTTQGTTCPRAGESLDVITVQLAGELSADGKRITLDRTGSLGEQSGTYHHVVNLQAQRE